MEHQNQRLVAQNDALIKQDKNTLAQFKTDLMAQVQEQVQKTTANLTTNTSTSTTTNTDAANHENGTTSIVNGIDNMNSSATIPDHNGYIWISDLQTPVTIDKNKENGLGSLFNSAFSNTTQTNSSEKEDNGNNVSNANTVAASNPNDTTNSNNTLSNAFTTDNFNQTKKPKPIPFYTLPVNATLTGAIAMQPLVGRVPIDGKVPDPYTFKAIISAKNLAANGVDIPSAIQGIVASGIAEGDMLGSCVRGNITALTFVFQDGHISTTQAKDGDSLGTIAAANGNPCIAGSFHSNAAIYLGAQAALAGFQGYGNALSQSQLSNVSSPTTGTTISSLIGSANKYALGQGAAASAQSAQQWWNQRVQNSFDFVYVPNVDPKTGKLLTLNINITQAIPIDYDLTGRKVFYSHSNNAMIAVNLD